MSRAALAQSIEDRRRWLAGALDRDAPFALWAMLRAPGTAGSLVESAALADWLAPRMFDLLRWTGPPTEAPHSDEWQSLAAASSAVAERAATLALAAQADAAGARWLGLLHAATEWLQSCGTPRPSADAALAVLPAELAQALNQLTAGQQSSGAAADFVRQAILAVRDAEPTSPARNGSLGRDFAESVPQLLARLARLDELEREVDRAVEREKLEALKEFAYGAGHEINNPLANISARAQTLLKDERDPERRQKLAAINTQAFRAHEMIADLMLFARPPAPRLEPLDAAAWLAELSTTWRDQAAAQHTEIELHVASPAGPVWADRAALAVALGGLVRNSLEALGQGGRVSVELRPAPIGIVAPQGALEGNAPPNAALCRTTDEAVEIVVRDTGPGIAAEIRQRIFDPYFSGREAGRGLGFGLSKCWRIVTGHGGRIDVASQPAMGAAFTITLPSGPPAAA